MRSMTLSISTLLLSMILTACGGPGYNTQTVTLQDEAAQSLAVALDVAEKQVTLNTTSDRQPLFNGEIQFLGTLDVQQRTGVAAQISLREDAGDATYTGEAPLTWALTLSEAMTTDLIINAVDANVNATLGSARLAALLVDAQASTMMLTMPDSAAQFPIQVDAADATLSLVLPDGSGAQLREMTLTDVAAQLTVGSGVSFDARVQLSGGEATFAFAPDVGVRVFTDATSGNITLPQSFQRTARNDSFVGDSTTYISANYEEASAQVTLRLSTRAGTVIITQG